MRLVLVLLSMLALATGLRVAPAAANPYSARAATTMALPSIADAQNLSVEEIEQEIFNAKKELFELRKGVKTRKQVAHQPEHTAQIAYPSWAACTAPT